jgi:hypothetical protein
MDEGEIMKDFHRGGGIQGATGVSTDRFAGKENEKRSDPLAPSRKSIPHRLIDPSGSAVVGEGAEPFLDMIPVRVADPPELAITEWF